MSSRAARRALLTLGGGLVLAASLTVSALLATPATAHDVLITTTPSGGDTVDVVPPAVVLTFAEAPLELGLAIQVLDPEGVDVASGRPVVAGATVTQSVRADSAAGAYVVRWRVTAADGHPTSSTFTFTALAAGGGPSSQVSTTRGLSRGSSGLWLVTVAVGVLAVGVMALVGAGRRRDRRAEAADHTGAVS